MHPRPLPFYRSQWTRWLFIATGAWLTYTVSPYAPAPWHDTPSLRWLHQVLPYWLMAGLCAVYVLMLARNHLTLVIVADYLGLALYLLAFVALLATLRDWRPTNPFAIAGTLLAVGYHLHAGRLAVHDREASMVGHGERGTA